MLTNANTITTTGTIINTGTIATGTGIDSITVNPKTISTSNWTYTTPATQVTKQLIGKITNDSLLYGKTSNFQIKDSNDEIIDNEIIDIIEYVPQKVYKIVFADKKEIKTILDPEDTFDPEYMLYLALAKKKYAGQYTFDGVLMKSYSLQYEKYYARIVKKGLQLFNTLQKEMQKKKEYDEIKKRQHEKYVRKRLAAKERKKKEQINIIAEAIRLSKEGK